MGNSKKKFQSEINKLMFSAVEAIRGKNREYFKAEVFQKYVHKHQ